MSTFALCLLLAIPYFFPTIVAMRKGDRRSYVISMFFLYLLVGWTFVGWWVIPVKTVDDRFNWFASNTPHLPEKAEPEPLPAKAEPAAAKLIRAGERFDFATQKWVPTYAGEKLPS
jgi:hypothetical protein